MAAIIGTKLGMSQVFTEEGSRVPVTVIEAGPCPVTGIRDAERDGYAAVQLAFGETEERKMSKPKLGHLKKAGAPPMRALVEFRDEAGELKVGDTVTVQAFEPGQRVKVSGVSVGKGFQGTIRRHGFSRGPKTHGSRNYRRPGSIGASADPARVFPGQKMPGHMGDRRVTQRGLEVVQVDPERNLLLIKGSVPGPSNSTVEVRTEAGGDEE
jgi:large subunit ribosomal protein L3